MKTPEMVAISNGEGTFCLDRAKNVLSVIRRFTQEYSAKVDQLIGRLEAQDPTNSVVVADCEEQIDELIQTWNGKVRKLGAVPRGLWLVDLDSGDGFFCWKFPESDLLYWHGYEEGFTKRIPIEEWQSKKSLVVESSDLGLDSHPS